MKQIPETLKVREHILPFCKTKPKEEVVDLNDGIC